ncbi:MAG: acyl-CoA thioesterase [Planctomycetota bacterium]
MSIRFEIQVAFGDADPAGIAYYPRILDYCHRAFEYLFSTELGKEYSHVFMKENIGYPTISLEASFRAPMHFGDRMAIDVSVGNLTKRKVEFVYKFTRIADNTHCATIKNAAVAADRLKFKSIEIPAEHAAMFKKHCVA